MNLFGQGRKEYLSGKIVGENFPAKPGNSSGHELHVTFLSGLVLRFFLPEIFLFHFVYKYHSAQAIFSTASGFVSLDTFVALALASRYAAHLNRIPLSRIAHLSLILVTSTRCHAVEEAAAAAEAAAAGEAGDRTLAAISSRPRPSSAEEEEVAEEVAVEAEATPPPALAVLATVRLHSQLRLRLPLQLPLPLPPPHRLLLRLDRLLPLLSEHRVRRLPLSRRPRMFF